MELKKLVKTLIELGSVEGPLESDAIGILDPLVQVYRNGYCCSIQNARSFDEDQGSFVINSLDDLPFAEVNSVMKSVASFLWTCQRNLERSCCAFCKRMTG